MNFQPIEKMETSEEPIQTTINNENFCYEAEEPISLSNENSPDNQNLNVLDAAESFLEEKPDVNPFEPSIEEDKVTLLQNEDYMYQVSQDDGCTPQSKDRITSQLDEQDDGCMTQEEERSLTTAEDSITPQATLQVESFTSSGEKAPQDDEMSTPQAEENITPQLEESFILQAGEGFAPQVEENCTPKVEESIKTQVEDSFTSQAEVGFTPQAEESLVPKIDESFEPLVEDNPTPKVENIQENEEACSSSDDEDDIEEREQEKDSSDDEEVEQPYEKLSEEKSLSQDVEMNSVEMQQDIIRSEPPASSELVHLNMVRLLTKIKT